ncbi:hypothetical protein [Nocardioides ferulae]|uniref:hypothetical protein n=1 Tax=Nocardioides ferulae TaxID=2340821 RepID=UPI000EB59FF1|nr:hypothetical protein [Nocardioides ferulae]
MTTGEPQLPTDRERRVPWGLVNGVLGALLVGLVAATAVTAARSDDAREAVRAAATDWGGDEPNALTRQHREVTEAARALTEAFLEVDYRDMQPLIDEVLSMATGDFAKEYEQRAPELIEAARENESLSSGSVAAIGVGEMDGDSALVYVAADSEVENVTTDGTKQPRFYRLQLDMVRDDGTWKAASVRFVG